jgi:hypothetical protein
MHLFIIRERILYTRYPFEKVRNYIYIYEYIGWKKTSK